MSNRRETVISQPPTQIGLIFAAMEACDLNGRLGITGVSFRPPLTENTTNERPGEFVVIVSKPEHYRNGLSVFHHVGQCAHLGGSVPPVLGVVDVGH
jgi:hypothetical protein